MIEAIIIIVGVFAAVVGYSAGMGFGRRQGRAEAASQAWEIWKLMEE